MEVGMLLRRLKDRVVKSRPGALRCIATSATLGGGRADFPHVAEFAKALFGEMFEWNEQDEERQDIIEPSIQDESHFSKTWGKPDPEFYNALQAHLGDIQTMAVIARTHGVPDTVVDQAVTGPDNSSDAFLYRVLRGDMRVQSLKTILRAKPSSLESAATAEGVFGTEGAGLIPALVSLVSLCAQAKPDGDSAPLISARFHLFCRALEGAFVTFPTREAPRLHLGPVDRIKEDGVSCQAFEIATCTRCGHTMLAGTLEDDLVRPRRPFENENFARKGLFLLGYPPGINVDEDEAALADAEPIPLVANPGTLCTACGAFKRGINEPTCNCDPERRMVVYEAPLRDGRLATCPACGAQTPYEDVVHRFYTGQDAPVAVLASSLYQHLPPESASSRPGGGRKLLAFL